MSARLLILSGLSGVGKTTLARSVARELSAVYVRADTIEQAMREGGIEKSDGLGYQVGYAIATENLRLGNCVIADSVNPWELTREAWRNAARVVPAPYLDVEVICADEVEHRRRVESRTPDIVGHVLSSWEQVIERDYVPWSSPRLVIDTATIDIQTATRLIVEALEAAMLGP